MSPKRVSVRTSPVQRRAADRIEGIIEAAALVLVEVGPERLTTTLVAERSGAGVGTVYRYFPDRIAILQGIADRNVRLLVDRFREVASVERPDIWADLTALFEAYVDFHRDLPGYRELRTGEMLPTSRRAAGAVVRDLVDVVADEVGPHYDVEVDAATRAAFVDTFHVVDAVVGAAFRDDPQGDDHLIALAFDVAQATSIRTVQRLTEAFAAAHAPRTEP